MKTDEELRKIIHDNEFFLPADSNARIVFFDKEGDEVIIEANVLMGSPFVGLEGEILEPHHRSVRYALRLKLKFSDFFMVATAGQAPQRDIAYSMQKLEELTAAYNERGDRLLAVTEQLAAAEKLRCAHATGKHDEECDLVAGLSVELGIMQQRVKDFEDDYHAVMEERCGDDRLHCTCVPSLRAAIKEAREEVFDLYHQACCVYNPLMAGVAAGDAAKYDNQCMSPYESIEEKLIEWGLLKPEQCLRRKK